MVDEIARQGSGNFTDVLGTEKSRMQHTICALVWRILFIISGQIVSLNGSSTLPRPGVGGFLFLPSVTVNIPAASFLKRLLIQRYTGC